MTSRLVQTHYKDLSFDIFPGQIHGTERSATGVFYQ